RRTRRILLYFFAAARAVHMARVSWPIDQQQRPPIPCDFANRALAVMVFSFWNQTVWTLPLESRYWKWFSPDVASKTTPPVACAARASAAAVVTAFAEPPCVQSTP